MTVTIYDMLSSFSKGSLSIIHEQRLILSSIRNI